VTTALPPPGNAGATTPRFAIRGLKVNLPWASYRQHRSLALHADTMREPAYWESLLDFMADCRLNLLSLWALHPFHYMIELPEYPEARVYSPEELQQWQTLWRRVFSMARQRGIQSYVFFWNIFVSPAFARAHQVASYCLDWHHIGAGDRSELVKDYNRACVRTLIDTYDELDGLGFAMSERMGGMTPEARAAWVEAVTIAGINDARRPVDVCLRVPHSAGLDNGGSINRQTESLGRALLERVRIRGRLWTEVKFNWSHGHSTPRLRKIHGGTPSDALWNPPPEKYAIAWMVRNEDFFVLRWADPDFVRQHIRLNGRPGVCGYLIGSECHIPAKDYISRPGAAAAAPKYAFDRHWLFYQVWGRLLHDPDTPDQQFVELIDQRHGRGVGAWLLPALKLASRVPLWIATFLNFTWDHTLYAEGFLNQQGLVTVDALIDVEPIEPAWMSVRAFVENNQQPTADPDCLTPAALADLLEHDTRRALQHLAAAPNPTGPLAGEIADVRAWASLGQYFACKLRAAIGLARARRGNNVADRDEAIAWIEKAIAHWRALADTTAPLYQPIPLQILKDRPFSWTDLLPDVEQDLHRIRTALPATPR
jgi:hypothetical protein